jgi:hypothetical protein
VIWTLYERGEPVESAELDEVEQECPDQVAWDVLEARAWLRHCRVPDLGDMYVEVEHDALLIAMANARDWL